MAPYYESAFNTWYRVWRDAFKNQFEMPGKVVHSDDFTRQSFWAGAFDGGHCAALVAYRAIDFRCPSAWRDSWFQFVPEDAWLKVTADKPCRGYIMSNVTVDFQYRSQRILYPLTLAGNSYALSLGFDKMLGLSNNSKNIDKLARAIGGDPVWRGIQVYNVDATFFSFSPEDVQSAIFSAPGEILSQVKKTKILIGDKERVLYEYRDTVVC